MKSRRYYFLGTATASIGEKEYRTLWERSLEWQVVCLVGNSTRPGTGLLNSLFDDVDQVLSIPHFREKVAWDYLDFDGTFEDLAERFLARNPEFFSSHLLSIERFDQLGTNADLSIKVDPSLFKDHLGNLLRLDGYVDQDSLFRFIHIAYSLSIGTFDELMRKKIIFYHSHTVLHTEQVCGFLREVKTIFMNRNPVNGIARMFEARTKNLEKTWSINQVDSKRNDIDLHYFFYQIVRNVFQDVYCLHNLKNDIYVVAYEVLHESPEGVISELCTRLGIEFDKKFLDSTFWGFSWGGDSGSEGLLYRFNDNPREDKCSSFFLKFEAELIEYILQERITRYRIHRNCEKKFKFLFNKFLVGFLVFIPLKFELCELKKIKIFSLNSVYRWLRLYWWRVKLMLIQLYGKENFLKNSVIIKG